MWTLHESKFVKIQFDCKSWGIGIDWRKTDYARLIYIDLLCLHFEIGEDPYPEGEI